MVYQYNMRRKTMTKTYEVTGRQIVDRRVDYEVEAESEEEAIKNVIEKKWDYAASRDAKIIETKGLTAKEKKE